MEPVSNLLIRACVSKQPIRRLKRVYRKFYCKDLSYFDRDILVLLARVIECYMEPISLTDLIIKRDDLLNYLIYLIREEKDFGDYGYE